MAPTFLVLLVLSLFAVGCAPASGRAAIPLLAETALSATDAMDSHVAYGLSLINDARAARGAEPLVLDSGLAAVGVRHATELAASTAIRGFANSAHQAFLGGDTGGATAENQGFWGPGDGNADFKAMFDDMMAEGPPPPGTVNHYSNLMDPAKKLIGIGLLYDATLTLWVSEEFE